MTRLIIAIGNCRTTGEITRRQAAQQSREI